MRRMRVSRLCIIVLTTRQDSRFIPHIPNNGCAGVGICMQQLSARFRICPLRTANPLPGRKLPFLPRPCLPLPPFRPPSRTASSVIPSFAATGSRGCAPPSATRSLPWRWAGRCTT
ncbi:hypothetical protein CBM2637_B10101 [Cupriavidus taiwanensis]|nr:hypothetical protein CBM2637_B10101 [Cupriavidus taiwanensis]